MSSAETKDLTKQYVQDALLRQSEARKRSELFQSITVVAATRLAIDQLGDRPLPNKETLKSQVELISPDGTEMLNIQLIETTSSQIVRVMSTIYSPSTNSRNRNFLVGFPISNIQDSQGNAKMIVLSTYNGLETIDQITSLLESIKSWPYTQPHQSQFPAVESEPMQVSAAQ